MHEQDDILAYLPHRYPFLLVDRIVSYDLEQQSLTAIKNVTRNEPFFVGHFPQQPVMPGVLMIECLAQAAGILIFKVLNLKPKEDELFYLASVTQARFKRVVSPGDQMRLAVKIIKIKCNMFKFSGKIWVDDHLVCSAEFVNSRG